MRINAVPTVYSAYIRKKINLIRDAHLWVREQEHDSHHACSSRAPERDTVQHPFCSINQPTFWGCQTLATCPENVAGVQKFTTSTVQGLLREPSPADGPGLCLLYPRWRGERVQKGFSVYLWTSLTTSGDDGKVLLYTETWRKELVLLAVELCLVGWFLVFFGAIQPTV